MNKKILTLVIVALIFPTIAFASWWNPFTWKIFNRKNTVAQVSLVSQPKPEELKKQVESVKKEIKDKSKDLVQLKKELEKSNKETLTINQKTDITSEEKKRLEEKYTQEQAEKQRQIDELNRQLTTLNQTVQKIAENTAPQTNGNNTSTAPIAVSNELIVDGYISTLTLRGWGVNGIDEATLRPYVKQNGVILANPLPEIVLSINSGSPINNTAYTFKPTEPGIYTFSYSVPSLGLSKNLTIKVMDFIPTPPKATFIKTDGPEFKIGKVNFYINDENYRLDSIDYRLSTTGDLTSSDIYNVVFGGAYLGSGHGSINQSLNMGGPLESKVEANIKNGKTGTYRIIFTIHALGITSSKNVDMTVDTGVIQVTS
jgi:Skp family chaperone for outer membrane proteins